MHFLPGIFFFVALSFGDNTYNSICKYAVPSHQIGLYGQVADVTVWIVLPRGGIIY